MSGTVPFDEIRAAVDLIRPRFTSVRGGWHYEECVLLDEPKPRYAPELGPVAQVARSETRRLDLPRPRYRPLLIWEDTTDE